VSVCALFLLMNGFGDMDIMSVLFSGGLCLEKRLSLQLTHTLLCSITFTICVPMFLFKHFFW
jgi:hypothetical protein